MKGFKIYVLCLISFFVYSIYAQTPTQNVNLDDNNSESDLNLQGQVPRIEFEGTKFDFGNIYRGSLVTHSFRFENTGNGSLILNSLHAACGCINTKIYAKDGKTPQNTFKPNEGGVIRVDFDSSAFIGNIVRSITAETNMGSSSPTVTLTLTANVLQELYSNPTMLYIGRVDKNIEKTFSINLNLLKRSTSSSSQNIVNMENTLLEQINKSEAAKEYKDKILNNSEALKIYSVESTSPAIEAKLIPTNNPNLYTVQIKVNNSLPIGLLNAKLIVWNNSTFYKNFQIPVVGDVVGHVESSAKYVEFGVVSDVKSAERVITYSSNLKNFTITAVKINLRRVDEMKDIRDGEIFAIRKERLSSKKGLDSDSAVAYQLHFKLIYPKKLTSSQSQEDSTGVNVSGNFLVKTNDPDYKEISVPFFGVLRKGP